MRSDSACSALSFQSMRFLADIMAGEPVHSRARNQKLTRTVMAAMAQVAYGLWLPMASE